MKLNPYYALRLLKFDFEELIIKSKKIPNNNDIVLRTDRNTNYGTDFIHRVNGIYYPIHHMCCYLHALNFAKQKRVTNRWSMLLYGYEMAFEDEIEKIAPFTIREINS